MKRRNVTAFIAAAAMTVSMLLSGCGGSAPAAGEGDTGQPSAEKEAPTQATLILYGEASPRMSDFTENEFHDKVLDAINVDVTVQYLPWSEYAGAKRNLCSPPEKNLSPIQTPLSYLNVFPKAIMQISRKQPKPMPRI